MRNVVAIVFLLLIAAFIAAAPNPTPTPAIEVPSPVPINDDPAGINTLNEYFAKKMPHVAEKLDIPFFNISITAIKQQSIKKGQIGSRDYIELTPPPALEGPDRV